jgi:hypothetical protein
MTITLELDISDAEEVLLALRIVEDMRHRMRPFAQVKLGCARIKIVAATLDVAIREGREKVPGYLSQGHGA